MKKVKLDELHLWDKNPRTIKDKRFEALCKSLTDDPSFMELRPILATKEGRIYAGNMRYRAAQHLGWTEVPAVITDIPKKLANERAIKDNNEFGDWNHDELATLLDEMEKQGTDISTLGLDEQINKIIEQLNQKEIVEDEVPAVKKDPKTKLGDVWVLGEHRVMCGDSTNADDIAKLMNGQKADLWLTDPPYGVSYRSNGAEDKHELIENDDHSIEEMRVFWEKAAANAMVATKDDAPYYWFACQGGDQMMMMMSLSAVGWKVRHELIWAKDRLVLGRCDYHYKHEPIFYGWKNKGTHEWFGDRSETSLLEFPKPTSSNLHPTMKPIELLTKLITNSSEKGDMVLDTFLGSGSTLIAAEQNGRRCYGIELAETYVRVIIDRWEKLTGEKATLA